MAKFDVAVIGGGPGGYPAAIRAAQLGASVALIEREALGGTCLNWGCIPTKSLIAGAERLAAVRQADELGIKAGPVSFDFAAMTKRKDAVVTTLRSGVAQLLKGNGVHVVTGTGSFLDRQRIAVTQADGSMVEALEADKVIVATGSCSAMPGFLPKDKRIMDSRAFLGLSKLPARLLVLGGGVIGCELACMAAQLDVQVTVVEMLDDILITLDADARREVRRHMEKHLGIRVLTGQSLEDIKAGKAGVRGQAGDKALEADVLLVAVGRRPVTDGLALDRAGLATNEHGWLEVDAFGRTQAATIYAIGDVTGGIQLAHAATSQGITAAENACGHTRRRVETLVPACIFTTPEVAGVGLTEQEAAEQGRAVKVGKFAFAALGKAMAAGESAGFVKWVADAETDQLLGAQAVGARATDLISEAVLAIRSELTVEELGRTIHCHPTFAEAWMEAAHAVHGTCIHQPPRKKR